MAVLSRNLVPLCISLSRDATLPLGKALHWLEGQTSIDAVFNANRVPVTKIANEGDFLLLVEVRCAEGASLDAFPTPGALLFVDPHHRDASVDMSRPGRTHLNAGRSGTIDTHDRNVLALAHEAHHTDSRERGHERPFMDE